MMPTVYKLAFQLDGIMASSSPVSFKAGDILFLPDSIASISLYQTVKNTNCTGLKYVLFLHDIIALRHNGVYEPSLHNNFKTSYEMLIDKSHSIICASETVMREVIQYNNDRRIFYDYAYLGADFESCGSCGGHKRLVLNEVFSRPLYLMVGTVEPRKNHLFVLDAFCELWNKGVDVSLCLVGKLGWLYDEIVDKVRSSKEFNNRLFMFNDVNDSELTACYERSRALIFASISEGFGLPLVEAMHFGKPVLVSDIPVFREIGGDYPFYFSLDNPINLANLIEDFELGTLEKHFTPRSWISWDEAIFNLMSKVVGNVATEPRPQQP
jgi:alpha-1,2-rhamnosyltransferase